MNPVVLSVRWRLGYLAVLLGQCRLSDLSVLVSLVVQCHQLDLVRLADQSNLSDQLGPVCPVDLSALVVRCRLSDQLVQCHLLALRDLLAQLVPVFLAVPVVLWGPVDLVVRCRLSDQSVQCHQWGQSSQLDLVNQSSQLGQWVLVDQSSQLGQ